MPWYSLSESGLILLDNSPPTDSGDAQMALANTLEQAAKLEDDPEAAAVEAGRLLYQKGVLSVPAGNLKELLDLAEDDYQAQEWLAVAADYPLTETDRQGEADPTLLDLAEMA
jgi:hypothetical protein